MEETRYKQNNDIRTIDSNRDEDKEEDSLRIATGQSMSDVLNESLRQAATKYEKPTTYTGNRASSFDDAKAKIQAKEELFAENKTVVDPYTGKRLVKTQGQAKSQFRGKWKDHSAESDHIVPLKKIYEEHKNNPWLTAEDIKKAANSSKNIRVTSRTVNNAKRDRTNKAFVEDGEYVKNKNVPLTEEGKRQAILDQKRAERHIHWELGKATVRNASKTGHTAGMQGAQNAGSRALAMSGIMNIVSVIKGEKSSEDAIADTVKSGGKAAVNGYVVDSTMTVVAHSLSNSSSKFIQALIKSNVPGKVISAVTTYGNTFKRYAQGEISTQECLLEIGENGLNLAAMGYFTGVGQVLIPIPVIGGAIGAVVGSALTSTYLSQLTASLRQSELEHQERLRIIEECRRATEQLKQFHLELKSYLAAYFKDYQDCFDSALSNMKLAYQMDNANDIITSANEITHKIGGIVKFETVNEFKDFLDSNFTDEL